MRRWHAVLLVATQCFGCGPLASTPDDHPVDPWRELLVHDAVVRTHEYAMNSGQGALSFAGIAPKLVAGAPSETSATDALDWLQRWAPARVSCQWLQATPSNHCNQDCTRCDAHDVAWEVAPVRLLAIVNRVDLSDDAHAGGEARLVYGLSEGPGDDARSAPLDATFIIEFRQTGEAAQVAHPWHELGVAGAIDDAFVQKLAHLVSQFAKSEHLARVRTHVGMRAGLPQMREFRAVGAPGTGEREWLPEAPLLARCEGCHAQEATGGNEFHLRGTPDGVAISRFLDDPRRPSSSEIPVRARELATLLNASSSP